jgi:membrane protein required for colicin V production
VDLGNFLGGISTVDLLIFLYFMAFFVLGFAQGTIRRLIGIASILFSFLFAANIAEPLGAYLGQNWTQFSKEYSLMIGFGTVFVASAIAFALVAQGLYKSQPLFPKARFLDELIGGILGLVEAALIFGAVLIILDSFFGLRGIAADPQELPFLRDFWTALDGSNAAVLFRDTLIPAFFAVFGFLIPDWLEAYYI